VLVVVFVVVVAFLVVDSNTATNKMVPQISNATLQISYSVHVPKIMANWLAVDKVIAKIIRLTFFGPPCRYRCHELTKSRKYVPLARGINTMPVSRRKRVAAGTTSTDRVSIFIFITNLK